MMQLLRRLILAFAMLAARMGWSLNDGMVRTVSCHAFPIEVLNRHLLPGLKLLILARNGETPAQAAVRELEEEVGIGAGHVELIGRFDGYETVTGFHVTPFVGVLKPGYVLRPDPGEVADVFEAPFDFLMDPVNHQRHSREWQGHRRHFYAMPWEGRYIWGATAGMLKSLHDRLYG